MNGLRRAGASRTTVGMGHILATLFPVFAVIALGYGLARAAFLSRGFLTELNRLVYYVSLPALIIHSLANARQLPEGTLALLLVFLGATSCVIGLAFVNARLLGLQRWQFGTFVQAALRGNLAFIGLPVIAYALRGEDSATVAAVLAQAVVVFAPTMLFYNVVSVILLLGSGRQEAGRGLDKALRSIATNPLILAALAGGLVALLPSGLPGPLNSTLDYIGRLAGPGALLCVGGAMAMVSMEGRYRSALFASVLKTAGVPLFAWLLSRPFGLADSATLVLLVFAATPTAVASYVLTKELHGDEAMAAGAIVISTLLSVLSLGAVVGLF